MMWVPASRSDAAFHATTSSSSGGKPQSSYPAAPWRKPSRVVPICSTTGRTGASSLTTAPPRR